MKNKSYLTKQQKIDCCCKINYKCKDSAMPQPPAVSKFLLDIYVTWGSVFCLSQLTPRNWA